MARYNRFTFLTNDAERRMIEQLAHRLSRSQGDAVRFVVCEAVRRLERIPQPYTEIELPVQIAEWNNATLTTQRAPISTQADLTRKEKSGHAATP